MPLKVMRWKRLSFLVLHKGDKNHLKKIVDVIVLQREPSGPSITLFGKMRAATNSFLLDVFWLLKLFFPLADSRHPEQETRVPTK